MHDASLQMMNIAKTAIIHPNVEIGEGTIIEDFCVIGALPRGKKEGQLKTVIGKNCHIRSHTVIYAGNTICDNFQTGNHVTIREENTIGKDVSIGTKSDVQHHVRIEDGVRIHTLAFIPEHTLLKKGSWLGPHVTITNDFFPKSKKDDKLRGVTLEEEAKVGANATILPGVTIGKNALVGAGSVVTKDVPANTVVVGNPAREIKKVHELKYPTGEKAY
jgi:acetyltransferase-like isoleucine patch superfamily enzyme